MVKLGSREGGWPREGSEVVFAQTTDHQPSDAGRESRQCPEIDRAAHCRGQGAVPHEPIQARRALAPLSAITDGDLVQPRVRIRAHGPVVRTAAKGKREGDEAELQAGDNTPRSGGRTPKNKRVGIGGRSDWKCPVILKAGVLVAALLIRVL